jgi:DNA-directed RNA polymerase specialized sigma24 family protein
LSTGPSRRRPTKASSRGSTAPFATPRSISSGGSPYRAIEAFARGLEGQITPEPELEAEICACVSRLAGTLKPEYAEALQAIDVQGTPVKAFAEQRGLSASNAGVRVFRAREALKKRVTESCGTCAEHGCRNCTCQIRG